MAPGLDRVDRPLSKFGRGLIETVLEHFANGAVTEAQVRQFLQLRGDEIFDAAHRLGGDVLE